VASTDIRLKHDSQKRRNAPLAWAGHGMIISIRKPVIALLLIGTSFALSAKAVGTCTGETFVHEANVENIKDFVTGRRAEVVTFQGYSGSEYEDPAAMLEHAERVLEAQDPTRVLVNIGATQVGIGAVYELAKRKGFATMGIVSMLARDQDAALSPCVDHVFFVKDSTWGGLLPEQNELSPTSQAIVDNSTFFVAIGGGDVARDELVAARQAGKPVTFIPADMNHAKARAKARKKNLPEPTDFRGSAHKVFGDESQVAR